MSSKHTLMEMEKLGESHAAASQVAWQRPMFDDDACWQAYMEGYRRGTPRKEVLSDPDFRLGYLACSGCSEPTKAFLYYLDEANKDRQSATKPWWHFW